MNKGWGIFLKTANEVHVMPLNDLNPHMKDPDCTCDPQLEPVKRDNGSYGWLYSHHSYDRREERE